MTALRFPRPAPAGGGFPWTPKAAPGLVRVARTGGDLADLPVGLFSFAGQPASLVLAFVSPHLNFRSVCRALKALAGPDVSVTAVTTAGELCQVAEGEPLYQPTGASWDSVVVQVFSRDLIAEARTYAVPLYTEARRSGRPEERPRSSRLAAIRDALAGIVLPFPIEHRDTLALTFVDGLSGAENDLMEAVYRLGRFPCLFIGGSAGGTPDFRQTQLFDGRRVLENHALLTFLKMAPGKRYGAFRSMNFRKGQGSMIVLKADAERRTVATVVDPRTLEVQPVIPAMARLMGCAEDALEDHLRDHTFGIELNDELFIRAVSRIDREAGEVAFFCDINTGDRLHLLDRTDFGEQTRRDYTEFLCGKSAPITGILNDCMLRRCGNTEALDSLDGLWNCPVAGFSTFGEMFGVNINQTLTGVFFFDTDGPGIHVDPFVELFPVHYGHFQNSFTLRRLTRLALINDLRANARCDITDHFAESPGPDGGEMAAIAGQARRERALRQGQEHLKAITESLVIGVLLVDERGVVRLANRAARGLLGCETAVARPLSVLLTLERDCRPVDFFDTVVAGVLRGGKAAADEDAVFHIAGGGARISVSYSVSELRQAGDSATAAVVSFRCIDALKTAQREALQASRLATVGQLAAGIAHEINTPIQYIGDNLHFLKEAMATLATVFAEIRTAGQAEAPGDVLERIVRERDVEYLLSELPEAVKQSLDGVGQVAHIVRSMKDFSHPGTSTPALTDLNEAIRSTLTVSRNTWKHVATVCTDLDPDLPQVLCFAADINQVFLNLIINAAQALAEGGTGNGAPGHITIRTRHADGWVTIRVVDNGPGIPPGARDRIFDPFFTTKAPGQGTGQGLSICLDVVSRRHGGTLTLAETESEEDGVGACFLVRLPVGGPPVPGAGEAGAGETRTEGEA